jgi:protein-S-isoprenylcysteine O-methyltransferase Ste14
MPDDRIFQLALILGSAFVFPIARYYRLKSRATRDRLDRRAEGLLVFLTLRPIAMIGMMGVAVFLVNPDWMAWSSVKLPFWVRAVGVGIGVIAAALRIVVFRTLGSNLTDTVVTKSDHTLVTTGPYRWVRHPLYVAFALAVLAYSITTANWFLGLTGLVTAALVLMRTGIEEQKLVERFGVEYVDYMRRTRRFFPRFGDKAHGPIRFRSPPSVLEG